MASFAALAGFELTLQYYLQTWSCEDDHGKGMVLEMPHFELWRLRPIVRIASVCRSRYGNDMSVLCADFGGCKLQDRIKPFFPEQLPDDARAVHDRILRERGYLPGPYQFWLSSAQFADHIEPVEKFLRHDAALDTQQVEVITLVVAHHWDSQYVWSSHAPAALRAGVTADNVDAIRLGQAPEFEREQDNLCYRLAQQLLQARSVPDDLWSQALSGLGEPQVNELLGLLGLYTSVCLTMVAYQVPAKPTA